MIEAVIYLLEEKDGPEDIFPFGDFTLDVNNV